MAFGVWLHTPPVVGARASAEERYAVTLPGAGVSALSLLQPGSILHAQRNGARRSTQSLLIAVPASDGC